MKVDLSLGFLRSKRKLFSIFLLLACIAISLSISTMKCFRGVTSEGFVGQKKASAFIDEIISDKSTDTVTRIAAIKSITTIMDKKDAKKYLEILEDSALADDDKLKKIENVINNQ
jgi:hypothetical protein